MANQMDLDEPADYDLYEEEDAPENLDQGAFKEKNPSDNRWERGMIHISKAKSGFKKTVEMILCVHGWEDSSHTQAMTVLAFRLHFDCVEPDAYYRSVNFWFRFEEDPMNDNDPHAKENPPKASPEVVAFAPFETTEYWNQITAQQKRNINLGGKAGVNQIGSAELNGGAQWDIAYERTYFDKGTAHPLTDGADFHNGVQWYLEQNKLQNSGVKPNLLVAMLLNRNTHPNGDGIPFAMSFDLRLGAGFWYDLKQGVLRFFRMGKLEDENVYFNPSLPPKSRGKEAKRMMEMVDRENLGDLCIDDMLVGLTKVPGLQPL